MPFSFLKFIRFDKMPHFGSRQWNVIHKAVHEADVTPVINDLNCIARQQYAASFRTAGPMQHRAAFKMPAAVNQRQILAEQFDFAFPKDHVRRGTSDPLPVAGVNKNRRLIESRAPFDDGRVIMRMRNRHSGDSAERTHFFNRRLVNQCNAVPQHIAARRLHEIGVLADAK